MDNKIESGRNNRFLSKTFNSRSLANNVKLKEITNAGKIIEKKKCSLLICIYKY